MTDDPSHEPAGDGMGADTRHELIRLLTHELRVAWDAAVAAGADPERLSDIVDERRKAIEDSSDDPS